MRTSSQRAETIAPGSMVVILDLRPPSRGAPAGLASTSGHQRILDWVSHAFNTVVDAELYFVAGARQPAITHGQSKLSVLKNSRWQTTGSVGALFTAPLREDRECYVVQSDLVFRSCLIDLLARTPGDAVIVADPAPGRCRGEGPGESLRIAEWVGVDHLGRVVKAGGDVGIEEASAALVGVTKLSSRAVGHVIELRRGDDGRLAKASISDLLRELIAHGLEVRAVEREGDWARLEAPQDLARFVLGTKAESLDRLRTVVRRCSIGPQVRFSVADWMVAPREVLSRVTACFGVRTLAVRSSSRSEDDWTVSRAGHFRSVLDVASDPATLSRAIDDVIASYGQDQGDHQVLIQKMLDSVQLSGVVFTRTLTHGMPYYTINYDDTTAHTGCVTDGTGKDLRTVVIHRSVASDPAPDIDSRLIPVLRAVRELEELVGYDSLDIEFALDRGGEVHILQLRPIVAVQGDVAVSDGLLDRALLAAGAGLERARARGPGLVGGRAYFGVMPDWNPAEIIGTCPRRLALSLYQHLITDEVWAIQRAACGYRDVRPNPLLITIAGHPYIDIRVSFNSFIPASIDDDLAERLVDHYLERLHQYPYLHDKVEFDIAFTCLAFDFDLRAREQLGPAGFTAAEIDSLREGLRSVTREILRRYPEDLQRIERLARRYDAIMQGHLDPLERACALLEDCRRYGTLSFAHLARGAFVAMTLLRSMTAVGLLDLEQQAALLNSLSTVTRDFERDGGQVAAGRLSWDEFIARYRHLRPGTYEITSPRYGDEPERYLRPATLVMPSSESAAPPGRDDGGRPLWPQAICRAIGDGLVRLGLPSSVSDLEGFLRATIEGREWSKFVFTRNLSQALDDLAAFAHQHGSDREQVSHMDLRSILQIRKGMSRGDVAAFIEARAEEGRREHRVALCAQLPSLIFEPCHLYGFERFRSQPNFVTSKRVVAPLVELSGIRQAGGARLDLEGRLVLVLQADPGYDWLFGYPLAGLITMYGGANSHLAIRAAEANLPAAIGVGETLYERLARAHVLELDCAGQQIRLIQ
jgi:choline kinase